MLESIVRVDFGVVDRQCTALDTPLLRFKMLKHNL
jgi:hypothetical protein